jgi:Ca2+-binding EF-hand superfamily protein
VKSLDLKGKGFMNYNEFIASSIDHTKVLTKKNIESAFKLFDAKNTGAIDISSLEIQIPKPKKTAFVSSVGGSKVVGMQSRVDTALEKVEEKLDTKTRERINK